MGNIIGLPGGTGQMLRMSSEGKEHMSSMSNSPNNSAAVNLQMQQPPQRFMGPGSLGFGLRPDVNKVLEQQHHQMKPQMHPHHAMNGNPSQVALVLVFALLAVPLISVAYVMQYTYTHTHAHTRAHTHTHAYTHTHTHTHPLPLRYFPCLSSQLYTHCNTHTHTHACTHTHTHTRTHAHTHPPTHTHTHTLPLPLCYFLRLSSQLHHIASLNMSKD